MNLNSKEERKKTNRHFDYFHGWYTLTSSMVVRPKTQTEIISRKISFVHHDKREFLTKNSLCVHCACRHLSRHTATCILTVVFVSFFFSCAFMNELSISFFLLFFFFFFFFSIHIPILRNILTYIYTIFPQQPRMKNQNIFLLFKFFFKIPLRNAITLNYSSAFHE